MKLTNIEVKDLKELLEFTKNRLTPETSWFDKFISTKEECDYEKRLYDNVNRLLSRIKANKSKE